MLYWSTVSPVVIFFKVSAFPTALASAAAPSCVSVVSVGGVTEYGLFVAFIYVLLSRNTAVAVRGDIGLHIVVGL